MVLTCVVAVVALGARPDSLDRVVLGMVINLILVVGLYTFVGVSGVFSFGHAAFMAIGAYAGAIFVIPPETKAFVLPDLPGFLARAHLDPAAGDDRGGSDRGRLRARALAVPLARLSGPDRRARDVRRAQHRQRRLAELGAADARDCRRVRDPDRRRRSGARSAGRWSAMAAAWAFQRSRVGLRLRASREDEAAARSIGVGVARERTVAFVLSAFFVGVAGALFGMFIGSFNPDAFFLNITFLMVAMLVIGGMTSLAGAVIGTIVISAVSELLRRIEGGVDLGLVQISRRSRDCARSVLRS